VVFDFAFPFNLINFLREVILIVILEGHLLGGKSRPQIIKLTIQVCVETPIIFLEMLAIDSIFLGKIHTAIGYL
jgi:hypothetical protein